MSDFDYQRLLLAIPRMSLAQLQTIRQRSTYQIQHRSDQVVDSVEDEDWLMHGILRELDRRGLDARNLRVKKPSSYAQFLTQSERVRALLLRAAPGVNAVQRRALGEVAGYELARYLTWLDINRETMLMNVGRVPEAIDAAYPGYMASKLLGLVVGAEVK